MLLFTLKHPQLAMLKKPLTTLLLFAATLFALNTNVRAADKPLRIGWVYAMANAPALIAQQKGFYQAEGLNVELISFGDGPVIQQALAAGELDAAYVGAPPVYQWFSRGLQGKILAKVNYGQAALITRRDGPIHTLADLRGSRIASVNKGSGMDVLLRGYVLKDQARLTPDQDVSVLSMVPGNMNAALSRGIVDAAFSWEPFVSQAVLRGDSRVLMDVNQNLPGYPWYVIMALPKTLNERPDDVVKLLRAHRKAIDYLNQHPTEANALIAQAFKLEPETTRAGKVIAPEAVVAEARKHLGWSADLNASDLQFIQRLMNWSHDLGFMAKPLRVEQVVDTSYLQRAQR